MANLLTRYGLKEYTYPYSISFIDSFLDCSYKVFLTHFLKIKVEKVDFPRVFGTGVHNGLNKINEMLMNHNEVCNQCPRECKLMSPKRKEALNVKTEDCAVKQILMEKFLEKFDDRFEELALTSSLHSTKEEIQEEIMKHKQYAFAGMCETIFKTQPRGEVLLTESKFSCRLGEHDILGIVDLAMGVKEKLPDGTVIPKTVILDYKTTGIKPSGTLPFRQLAVYSHLLENSNIKVNKVGAIYILKKGPPKVVKKGAAPFQQVFMAGADLDQPEWHALKEKTLDEIQDDICMIKDQISHGIFTRNRKSMFCSGCELRGLCSDTRKLDKLVENGYGPIQQETTEDLLGDND